MKGRVRNDLMEVDGISLKPIPLGEGAEYNLRGKMCLSKLGPAFAPQSSSLLMFFPLVSPSHIRCSLWEEEAEHRHSFPHVPALA